MKISNKDVIQSYLFTTARYNFDVYEKRILYRLVELCQPQLEGQGLNDKLSINHDLWGNRDVKVPISMLLNKERDTNHFRIKKALRSLNEKRFEYQDTKKWKIIRLIEMPEINRYNEFVEFKIHKEIYQAILDFSSGYRKYELATAMKFNSIYAMRFYELLSGKKDPITYPVSELKKMFQIENKYKLMADFTRFVVNAAKKELNKHSPWSFDFKTNKTGRKITSITFFPVYIQKNRDPNLDKKEQEKKLSTTWFLDEGIKKYLKNSFGFTTAEIKNNLALFTEANQKLDLMLEISTLKIKSEKKRNKKGYVINTIRGKLNDLNKL